MNRHVSVAYLDKFSSKDFSCLLVLQSLHHSELASEINFKKAPSKHVGWLLKMKLRNFRL